MVNKDVLLNCLCFLEVGYNDICSNDQMGLNMFCSNISREQQSRDYGFRVHAGQDMAAHHFWG